MRKIRYRRALNEALREEMQRDEAVYLIGEDLRDPWGGTYKVTERLSVEFGDDRVLNTPISEGAIVGAALGSALTGLRPVAEMMYWDFAFLAADQIVNQVAKLRYMTGGQVKVPLVIRGANGGYKNSAAQHGQCLETFFAQVPGLLVAAPSTPADAKGLLKTAIRLDDPVIFMEHKSLYLETGEVPEGDHLVPFGQADVKRPGRDVTIVAWGKMVGMSLHAAERLEGDGIDVEVLDIRTLVPLDEEAILESVGRTGRVVVVSEAPRRGTFGAEIAALVAERLHDRLQAPVRRVAALNVPLPMAPNLEPLILPQIDTIVEAVQQTVSTSSAPTAHAEEAH
jgi:pyruvate dehydrogenase E1 component beta subunit